MNNEWPYGQWRQVAAATWRSSIQPHRLYLQRGGRQVAAPTVTLVSGTVHPHGLYMQRCLAMNHRRYIAWFHSTTQVIFETWRAASSRPYWRNSIYPTQSKNRPRPLLNNCQLSIVNCQFKRTVNCKLSTVNYIPPFRKNSLPRFSRAGWSFIYWPL